MISDLLRPEIYRCLPPKRGHTVSSAVNSLKDEIEKALKSSSVIATPGWANIYLVKTGGGGWIAGVDDGSCFCYGESMDMFHEINSVVGSLMEKLW
jgi:hypothetical protein